MTIEDYIKQKFQTFGIVLPEADILDITLNKGLDRVDILTDQNIRPVSIAIATFIPSLLLRPVSVSESGFSMSFDISGIKDYYSFLCSRYGIKDELSLRPKVSFL